MVDKNRVRNDAYQSQGICEEEGKKRDKNRFGRNLEDLSLCRRLKYKVYKAEVSPAIPFSVFLSLILNLHGTVMPSLSLFQDYC